MEHRFCLDEILGKVSEMINDGYHYGSIDVLEDCLLDNGQHGAIMCFVADDEGLSGRIRTGRRKKERGTGSVWYGFDSRGGRRKA